MNINYCDDHWVYYRGDKCPKCEKTPGMTGYVIVIGDDVGSEEFDVIARSEAKAREIAKEVLKTNYQSGIKIKKIHDYLPYI